MKRKLNIKAILITLIIVIVVMIAVLLGMLFIKNDNSNNSVNNVTEIVAEDKYYSIRSNATDLQKDLYEQLNEAINNNDIESASGLLVENFVADFFTLSNKTIKNDVGGVQFWPIDRRLNFREKAINSVYFNYELMCRDYGQSELPEVETTTVEYVKATDEEGIYKVKMTWTYKEKSFNTNAYMNLCRALVDTNSEIPYIISFE